MKKVQDYYFNKARKEGYAARSAFKLEEIDKKHKIIKPGFCVIDLGCFPGSWMQYIAKKVGKKGLVVGIDRTQLKINLTDNMRHIHSDINELDSTKLGEFAERFDLVCSDMAPNSTGVRDVDAARSLQLCQMAQHVALQWLKKRGAFLVKCFQGPSFDPLLKEMRGNFEQVKIVKPKSSRNESREIFLLGIQLKTE